MLAAVAHDVNQVFGTSWPDVEATRRKEHGAENEVRGLETEKARESKRERERDRESRKRKK